MSALMSHEEADNMLVALDATIDAMQADGNAVKQCFLSQSDLDRLRAATGLYGASLKQMYASLDFLVMKSVSQSMLVGTSPDGNPVCRRVTWPAKEWC